jgi:hypothetical protein
MRVLAAFRSCIDPDAGWDLEVNDLPRICIYCFARSEGARPTVRDVEAGVRRRVAMALDPVFHEACVAASRAAGMLVPAADTGGSACGGSERVFGGLVDDGSASGEMLLDDVPAYKPVPGEPLLPAWAEGAGVTVRGVRDVSPRKLMVLVEIESPPRELVCLPTA